MLELVSETLSELSTNVRSQSATQERRQILDWLSSHDPDPQYRRGYQLHCSHTCRWLLEHPEFIRWSQCRSALLWMHGQAGSGKTVATSYLIHHLRTVNSQAAPEDRPLLAYFYYDASTVESLTPETFFGAICRQFCAQLPQMPEAIVDAYTRAAGRRASLNELERFVRLLIGMDRSAVIVVDGLDESPDYAVVADFLTSAVMSKRYPLRVFVSSRPEVDLRRRFSLFQELDMPESAIERDVGVYIKTRIDFDARLRRMSPNMKKQVEMSLREGCHGM